MKPSNNIALQTYPSNLASPTRNAPGSNGSGHAYSPVKRVEESKPILAYNPRKIPLRQRLAMARARLRHAAENGIRVRVYEVALDLDMSEFHFARQFRAAYGYSPHVYYDEVRAARGRDLLRSGVGPGDAARRIGLRRPAELRALLARRQKMQSMSDVEPASVMFPAPATAENA